MQRPAESVETLRQRPAKCAKSRPQAFFICARGQLVIQFDPMKRRRRRPAQPTPTSAVAYVRVSTSMQATSGVSLDAQRSATAALAQSKNLPLVYTFEDAGVSGTIDDRPGLNALKAHIQKNPDTLVVVYSMSRLGRSLAHLSDLIESGWHIASCTEPVDTSSAAGRMVVNLFAVFAQFERELIAERTSAALRELQADGIRVGRPPTGYIVNPETHKLERDPDQDSEEFEARIKELAEAGRSVRDIANELGVPHPRVQRRMKMLGIKSKRQNFIQAAETRRAEAYEALQKETSNGAIPGNNENQSTDEAAGGKPRAPTPSVANGYAGLTEGDPNVW